MNDEKKPPLLCADCGKPATVAEVLLDGKRLLLCLECASRRLEGS